MALGDLYVTSAELKARLELTDTVDDVRISGAVLSATDGVNAYAKRDFQKTTVATARVYLPAAADYVRVHDFHSSTITLKIDQDDDGVFETTIPSTDYQLTPLNGVVEGVEGWPFWAIEIVAGVGLPCSSRAAVQLTAQWGWNAVPVSVKEAAYVLAEDIFKLRDAPFGVGGFGEFGRIRARENPHVALLLARYRRDQYRVRPPGRYSSWQSSNRGVY